MSYHVKFFCFCMLIISGCLNAQEYSAGFNVANPNPNAVLHLVSPNGNQGLLIPQLTASQRDNMSLNSDDNGLIIYVTDDSNFYYWDGSAWAAISNTDEQTLADVLSRGTDGNGERITNIADPINAQDVATKNYVDNQDSDSQTLSLIGTDLSITNGNTVDISSIESDPVWLLDRTIISSPGTINSGSNLVDWTQLKNVPTDFSDGIDNGITNLAGFDTDDLTEGTTNLYFTNARIGTYLGANSVTSFSDVTNAGSGAIITAAERTQLASSITNISGFDTDDLTEGTTNRYYTDARVGAYLGANSVTSFSDVTNAGSGAIITAAERTQLASSITNISGFDTDDLTEGTTNLYFTNARVGAYLGANSVTSFSDVTNAGSGAIITAAERTQLASSITNISGFDTDDLTEGTTNLYFANARVGAYLGANSVTSFSDVTNAGSGAIITAAERTQLASSITNISGFDTDDLTEGTTNLYFTNARVGAYLGANSVTSFSDVTSVGSGAIITAAERTQLASSITNISGFDTDDLTEGATNLYFTNARVGAYLGANSVTSFSDVTNAGSGAIITAAERTQLASSISNISGFDTDDLTEGTTNLYYTDARVGTYLGANSITGFSDVTNAGSGAIITAAERTQLASSISNISGFDTDDLTEGTTNLYYTDARVGTYLGANSITSFSDVTNAGSGAIITAAERTQLASSISNISGFDTDDLTEGTTNLYYTDARVGTYLGANSITSFSDVTNAGSGAIITAAERTQLASSISNISGFDTDDLTEGTTNLYFTNARVGTYLGANSVTSFSDVTNAGSGAIITVAERSTLSSALTSGDLGSSVQAQSARLDDVAGLTPTDGNFVIGDGTNFIVESGATARTSLGLGTSATIDVGTAANQIVQLNASGELPALDGSNLTGLTITPITTTLSANNFDASAVGDVVFLNRENTGDQTFSNIINGTTGQEITFISNQVGVAFTDKFIIGGNVVLGNRDQRPLEPGASLTLRYDGTDWVEVAGTYSHRYRALQAYSGTIGITIDNVGSNNGVFEDIIHIESGGSGTITFPAANPDGTNGITWGREITIITESTSTVNITGGGISFITDGGSVSTLPMSYTNGGTYAATFVYRGGSTWLVSNQSILNPGDMAKVTYDGDDNGIVDDTELVNGLTVQTAVPASAIFTDNQTLLSVLDNGSDAGAYSITNVNEMNYKTLLNFIAPVASPRDVNYNNNTPSSFGHVIRIPTDHTGVDLTQEWWGRTNNAALEDGLTIKVVNTSGAPMTFFNGGFVAIPGGGASYTIPVNGVISMIWLQDEGQWFIED